MSEIQIKLGDTFCVGGLGEHNSLLLKSISFIERLKDVQTDYHFAHSGIITSSTGQTFESLLRVQYGNLSAYEGEEIIIGRAIQPVMPDYLNALNKVVEYHNQEFYPIYRLPLHLLGLAKFVHWHKVVCSELVVQYYNYVFRNYNIYQFENWFGWEPGNLAYTYEYDKRFDVVYKGEWSRNLIGLKGYQHGK